VEELSTVLQSIKSGKAAGFEGIYPEFIKNARTRTKEWILSLLSDVLATGRLFKLFKHAKIITILKPGKDGSDSSYFRSISLLSVVYKLLERMILQRIQPLIEDVIPKSQVGFRKHRSSSEQVMAVTSYDTVWRGGLMLKFTRVVPCAKMSKLLNNMLSNRFFQVFLGDKTSRWRRLNNSLTQGSVLALMLFSLVRYSINIVETIPVRR
jgi:Reverse transcriptase (RNA-dependent DNA polymerase)